MCCVSRDTEVIRQRKRKLKHGKVSCITMQMWTAIVKVFIVFFLLPQGSSAMSQILVQKLGALAHMSSLLKSPNRSLQKTVMSLMGNMSRSSNLQTSMGKKKLKTCCCM